MSSKRILIVEDDPLVRRMASNAGFRTESDCQLDIVADGQEAMDFLAKESYDLVITDLSMPVLNGRDLYLRTQELCIKESRPVPPFIFCSGVQAALSGVAMYCTGTTNRMLLKPFSIRRIREVVNELFQVRDQEGMAK